MPSPRLRARRSVRGALLHPGLFDVAAYASGAHVVGVVEVVAEVEFGKPQGDDELGVVRIFG